LTIPRLKSETWGTRLGLLAKICKRVYRE